MGNIHESSLGEYKDVMGRPRTQSLFYEYRTENYTPIFTLKPYNHTVKGVTYPSLKLIYMDLVIFPEEGEYNFAMQVFGEDGWTHWMKLIGNQLLYVNVFQGWREELEVRYRSRAIQDLIDASGVSVSASKYVAEKGWEKKAGRPTKESVAGERRIAAGITAATQDEYDRLQEEGLLN